MALSTLAAAAVVGTGAVIVNGEQQAKMQKRAMQQAKKAADADARQRDQEFNRLNQKRPGSLGDLMAANLKASKGAQGGTMLTGAQGAAVSGSQLGRTTLLGG